MVRKIGDGPPLPAVRRALSDVDGPAYVKTACATAVATVLDAVATLEEPPAVRVLAPRQVLDAGVRDSSLGGRARELIEGDVVALRESPATVTNTTLVTARRVRQFREGAEDGERPDVAPSFVESVYEAHVREWERADPVTAPERQRV